MTALAFIPFLLFGFLLAVLLSALYSGAETAAITANEAGLRQLADDGDRSALRVLHVLHDRRRVLSIVLVGTNLASVMAALLCDHIFSSLGAWLGSESMWFSVLNFLVVTPILLLFGEIVPKHYCRLNADRAIKAMAGFLQVSGIVLVPMLNVCTFLTGKLLRPFGFDPERARDRGEISVDDIREMVGDGGTAGGIERSEQFMISRIFDLRETIVREVMQPLPEIVSFKIGETTLEMVREKARETGYSRFPVFRERSFRMDGYIDVYDVLRRGNGGESIEPFILEPFYCPETMASSELLKAFLRNRMPAAIVVDEHGGTVGWVTREDILEEVVGEIEDEFDPLRPREIEVLSDSKLRLSGSIDLDDLTRLFEFSLPKDEDFDTLGGLIVTRLGRVAEVGDVVAEKTLRLTIEAMDGVRIEKVIAEVMPPPPQDDPDEDAVRQARWRRRLALIRLYNKRNPAQPPPAKSPKPVGEPSSQKSKPKEAPPKEAPPEESQPKQSQAAEAAAPPSEAAKKPPADDPKPQQSSARRKGRGAGASDKKKRSPRRRRRK